MDVKTLQLGDYTVTGYSRTLVGTAISIKELKLIFDMGVCPYDFVRIPRVFLTHLHPDHSLGIYTHIGIRNAAGYSPSQIYLPAEQQPLVEKVIKTMGQMNLSTLPCEILPVHPEESTPLNRNFFIKSFKTDHSHDSLGYTVFESRQKLKEAYRGLPKQELGQLRKRGIKITHPVEAPILTYTGDATKDVLTKEWVRKSRILICECTFLGDQDYNVSENTQHLHLSDLVDARLECEHLMLCHFSIRYGEDEIRQFVDKARLHLPPQLHLLL